MLTSTLPTCPPLDNPMSIEEPFLRLTLTRQGPASRLEVKMLNRPITDEGLDNIMVWAKTLLIELARRPEMTMMVVTDMTEAGVPAMRHVKRFMAWAKENGDLMNFSIRGNAIVLKPSGFVGHALVNIIKMVQRLLQATWPETLVPTVEEADKFLAQHQAVSDIAASELDPSVETDTSVAIACTAHAPAGNNSYDDHERHCGSGSPGSTVVSGGSASSAATRAGSLASASTATPPSETDKTSLPNMPTAIEPKTRRCNSTSALLGRASGVGDNACRTSRQPGAAIGKPRGSRTSSIAPELARLDVPVWVDMGYRPGPRLGKTHNRVKDTHVFEPGAPSVPLLEMCGGCSRDRRFPATLPRPRRRISQFSV